jgi:large subunit ribosomal protein L33
MREIITLECSKCKSRNYNTTKNKKKQKAKLELSKFCKRCRAHAVHKEIK